jgi:hypothetical protein
MGKPGKTRTFSPARKTCSDAPPRSSRKSGNPCPLRRRTGFTLFAHRPISFFYFPERGVSFGEPKISAGDAINFYSEGSFQAFVLDYHPYPSSKRREGPVLAFGAGATDVPSARGIVIFDDSGGAGQNPCDGLCSPTPLLGRLSGHGPTLIGYVFLSN